jgi:peptide/nickel transport system substrate-binding protein
MNKKTVVLVFVLMLVLSSCPYGFEVPQSQATSRNRYNQLNFGATITVTPESPTTSDKINITVSFDLANSNEQVTYGPINQVSNGFFVNIDIYYPQILLPAIGYSDHTYNLGQLPAGSYSFTATVTTSGYAPSSVESYSKSFTVSPIKRPYELISATVEGAGPETVDPSWSYDVASGELISNVYDTLLTFDGEHTDSFIPRVAMSLPTITPISETSPEGLPWHYRYTFQIRQGIKFQDESYTLTPQDVEYSIERELVMDRDGGPQWMLYEPLLNGETATYINGQDFDLSRTEDIIKVGKMIDHAVESNGTHVWFNLAFPGAYAPFLQILCQTCSSIMSEQWVKDYVIGTLARKDWNGNFGDYTDWVAFHNPDVSPLDNPTPIAMGSGPFMLESLDYTAQQWSAARFEDYWDGWPASFPSGHGKPAGYVNSLVVTWAYDWETRETLFLNGDVDFCAVPRQYDSEVLDQPGIRCVFPLPELACDALFFQFNIDPTTPYGPILPAGTFAEDGIPTDFFGNHMWSIHVRKAFAFSLDYNALIADVFQGEATHPATAIIQGLTGYDPTIQGYAYNLTAAVEEFKKVPGLWNTGFTITLAYNTGNTLRQGCAELLKESIEALNPKFHVNTLSLYWQTYEARWRQLPTFIQGWLADYPDAHDFALPFYGSTGYFAAPQGYSNPTMDALINQGIAESDAAKRAIIDRQIQALAIADCPSITLAQPVGRHFERDWVNGWYYNPVYPGIYGINLWKVTAPPDKIIVKTCENMSVDVIARRYPRVLQPGEIVTPCVQHSGLDYVVKPNRTVWLYWIDTCPYAMFAHPCEYVFVDAQTGDQEVYPETWGPSLNGVELWSTPEEYWNRTDWVYSTVTNQSVPTPPPAPPPIPPTTSKKRALIIEGHVKAENAKYAAELWYNTLLNLGYSDQQIMYLTAENEPRTDYICTRQNVFVAIQNLSGTLNPGDDLTLFIVADGETEYENNLTAFVVLNNVSTVLYNWELKQSLSQINEGVHVDVVVQSCCSGSFMNLWTLKNVEIILTATDWKSYTYMEELDPPRNYQFIANLTADPDSWARWWGAEFTSGLVEGLNESRRSFLNGSITIGELYVKAFKKAKECDAGYINREKLVAAYSNDTHYKPNPLMNTVFFKGDINHDGKVNILDISKAAVAYNSRPGDAKWDPESDADKNAWINIVDLAQIATNYLTVYFTNDP